MNLIDAFIRNATDAQAGATVVRSPDAARARVAGILRDVGARLVMVSPDAVAPPWSCDATLAPVGARVVTRSATNNDRAELLAADAGVTLATHGLADTGTLVVCSSPHNHRLDSLVVPIHIALLRASDLLPDLPSAFATLAEDERFERHSAVTFIRGPSRTADIELQLTLGVHGPGKVHIVVLDGR